MKTSQHRPTRTVRATRLLGSAAFAALLAATAAPSFAGNYGEGDPRPASFSSSTTREAVTAETRQWLRTAPTQGYTDGTPQQQVTTVSANSRAAVAADTRLWMRSGLAAKQSGETGADPTRPGYRQAVAEYARLRASPAYGALIEQLDRQAAAHGQSTLR